MVILHGPSAVLDEDGGGDKVPGEEVPWEDSHASWGDGRCDSVGGASLYTKGEGRE